MSPVRTITSGTRIGSYYSSEYYARTTPIHQFWAHLLQPSHVSATVKQPSEYILIKRSESSIVLQSHVSLDAAKTPRGSHLYHGRAVICEHFARVLQFLSQLVTIGYFPRNRSRHMSPYDTSKHSRLSLPESVFATQHRPTPSRMVNFHRGKHGAHSSIRIDNKRSALI